MYISHYNLAEKPFQINTDPKFLWLGEIHKEALAVLKYGVISRNGILVLTGDVGTGKTTLINALIDGLDSKVVVVKIGNSNIDLMGFLSLIGTSLHIPERFNKVEDFIFHFSNFLERKFVDNIHVLLIVDEAHKLCHEILEQIRLLLNIEIAGKNLVSIYLVGQNELNKKLLSPKYRALRQRVTIHYQIKPLSESETLQYCLHRLKVAGCEIEIFNQEAITEIYRFAKGYPRLINIICDRALLAGYVEEVRTITPAMIQECSQELRLPGENEIITKYRLTGMLSSVFNYISNLFLQPKIPEIYYQIKKQTKHVLAHFFNPFIAGLVFKLSKGLAEKRNRPVAAGIKITETQKDTFNQNRRRNKKVFLKEYSWERRTYDIISRFTNSGLRNTALAICSVALTLAWSLWYQGILSTESNLSTSDSSVVKPSVMDSYQVEHYGVPFAESNVADNTESMKFTNKPSKKLESSKFGLKEKFNVNNLDEFDTVAINKMEETKKTEPSTNKTTKSQIFVQKSNDVVRQDVGRSESSIGFSNWSKAAYSIQVGAFLNKDNAIKMATILEKKGYSANIVKFNDAKGRVWHTVRIGKYASWRAANKHAKDFSSKQRLDSIVRPIGRF
jgi:type II secretory pathway predicted ATPase ExeA/septal ring-binding cell division protein DamX